MQTGFKKHIQEYKEERSSAESPVKPRFVIKPYAERRAERIEREKATAKEAAPVEVRGILKPSIPLHPGVMIDPIAEAAALVNKPPHKMKEDMKLPEITKLVSAADRENYFGSNARATFFEYFQDLSRRRQTEYIEHFAENTTSSSSKNSAPTSAGGWPTEELMSPPGSASGLRRSRSSSRSGRRKSLTLPIDAQPKDMEQMTSTAADLEGQQPTARQTYSRLRKRGSVATLEEENLLLDHLLSIEQVNHRKDRPSSARTRFLRGCLEHGVLPQPALIIRKELTTILNISAMGIGNEMCTLLARSLELLPVLEGLLIADNNLSDEGLVPIVKKLSFCKYIQRLDISSNKIESECLKELTHYFTSTSCQLIDLKLRSGNLDDYAVRNLISSFSVHSTLQELDMSYNQLGSHDMAFRMSKTLLTAGESIGKLLKHPECKLSKLALAWNTIRHFSGVTLVESLKVNQTLTFLDLSYNGLGVNGGEMLGLALHYNRALKTLKVIHNNISARPAMVIVSGIKSCESLTLVDLSENPIGEEGARGVLVLNITHGQRVKVEIRNCQVRGKDPTVNYQTKDPKGEYSLELSQPYHFAVAMELLRTLARDTDLKCTKSKFDDGSGNAIDLNLVLYEGPAPSADDKQEIDEITGKPKKDLKNAEATFDSVKELFREAAAKIFEQFDADGSGTLERSELAVILKELGFPGTDELVEKLMGIYDTDGTGAIEEDEFVSFLLDLKKNYERETSLHSTVRFIYNNNNNEMVKGNAMPIAYFPPDKGRLTLKIDGTHKETDWTSTISHGNVLDFLEASKSATDKTALFEVALVTSKWTFTEGKAIFHVMVNEIGSVLQVLLKLLPRMSTPFDVRMLIAYVTNQDYEQVQHLKYLLGPLYRVLIGIPNGFYRLYLNDPNDRLALEMLFELSCNNAQLRKRAEKGDTSQCGDWMGFRNAVFEGQPMQLNEAWFEHGIPEKGRLDFDFISTEPISMKAKEVSNLRFFRLMVALGVLQENKRKRIFSKLQQNKSEGREASKGNGSRRFETLPNAAKEIFEKLEFLYGNYTGKLRKKRPYNVVIQSEEVSTLEERRKLRKGSSANDAGRLSVLEIDTGSVMNPTEESMMMMMPESPKTPGGGGGGVGKLKRHRSSLFRVPSAADSNGNGNNNGNVVNDANGIGGYAAPEYRSLDMYGVHIKEMLKNYSIDQSVIAMRYLDALEIILAGRLITCAQLGLITEKFPFGNQLFDDFGTYRVELIVSLYSRVIDKINMEYVLKELENAEIGMLYFRLGWLNIWNPLKPEGNLYLNFARHEERQVARALVLLNYIEPGETWQEATYRVSKDQDPEPDWVLPAEWYSEQGLPRSGVLSLLYFSGRGVELQGCVPNVAYRLSLMSLVLSQPYDEDVTNEVRLSTAEQNVKRTGMGLSFLAENQQEGFLDPTDYI